MGAASAVLTGVGTVLGGIGSIGSSIANRRAQSETNKLNYQMFKEQQAFDEQMYDRQVQDTWRMWNANNEYNSAESQVGRLKAAGLNPAMMLGSTSAGTAQTTSAPATPHSASPIPAQAPQINSQSLMQGIETMLMLPEQVNAAKLDNIQRQQTNQARDIELRTKAYEIQLAIAERIENIKDKRLQNELRQILKQETIRIGRADATAKELQNEWMKTRIELQMTENAIANINLQWLPVEKKQAYLTSTAQLNNLIVEGQLKKKSMEKLAIEIASLGLSYQQQVELYNTTIETAKQELIRLKNNSGPQSVTQGVASLLTGSNGLSTGDILTSVQKHVVSILDWAQSNTIKLLKAANETFVKQSRTNAGRVPNSPRVSGRTDIYQ